MLLMFSLVVVSLSAPFPQRQVAVIEELLQEAHNSLTAERATKIWPSTLTNVAPNEGHLVEVQNGDFNQFLNMVNIPMQEMLQPLMRSDSELKRIVGGLISLYFNLTIKSLQTSERELSDDDNYRRSWDKLLGLVNNLATMFMGARNKPARNFDQVSELYAKKLDLEEDLMEIQESSSRSNAICETLVKNEVPDGASSPQGGGYSRNLTSYLSTIINGLLPPDLFRSKVDTPRGYVSQIFQKLIENVLNKVQRPLGESTWIKLSTQKVLIRLMYNLFSALPRSHGSPDDRYRNQMLDFILKFWKDWLDAPVQGRIYRNTSLCIKFCENLFDLIGNMAGEAKNDNRISGTVRQILTIGENFIKNLQQGNPTDNNNMVREENVIRELFYANKDVRKRHLENARQQLLKTQDVMMMLTGNEDWSTP